MISFLRNLDLPSPRVLDLGAHVGDFAKQVREHLAPSHVACVEASEECLPYLYDVADDVRWEVLWDEPDETVPFWKRKINAYGGSSGNSCFRETTGFFDDEQVANGNVWCEQRRTTTLDSLYGDAPAFDLVKMDLQGAELKTIRGGRKTLSRATVIVCEQQRVEYNAGAPMAPEVDHAIRFLCGGQFREVFRRAWESEHEIVGRSQVDRIYVRIGCELDRGLVKKGSRRARPRKDYSEPGMGR